MNFQEYLNQMYTTATLAMRLDITTDRAMTILRGDAQTLTMLQINRLFTDMSVEPKITTEVNHFLDSRRTSIKLKYKRRTCTFWSDLRQDWTAEQLLSELKLFALCAGQPKLMPNYNPATLSTDNRIYETTKLKLQNLLGDNYEEMMK
jgi:hypothetical protein